MSSENKATLRRFFEEIFNQQELAVADEIVAADYINHNPAPGELPGRDGLKQFVAYLHSANEGIRYRDRGSDCRGRQSCDPVDSDRQAHR